MDGIKLPICGWMQRLLGIAELRCVRCECAVSTLEPYSGKDRFAVSSGRRERVEVPWPAPLDFVVDAGEGHGSLRDAGRRGRLPWEEVFPGRHLVG